jgi:hypothetical protein
MNSTKSRGAEMELACWHLNRRRSRRDEQRMQRGRTAREIALGGGFR